ncbi:GNAT family N-acetyltransferase [Streptomyces sp. NPDC050273]|uniref:GNAT family N-acetyltransferase n=1 Tax=Streptomyces sp. NPDC050273 TaxID=3154933 RepID=UPI00341FFB78
MVVAGTTQRRGVGRLLMDSAVRLAEESGCYKVPLLVADEAYVPKRAAFKAATQGFCRYVPSDRF